MPPRDPRMWLQDVCAACDVIQIAVAGLSIDTYTANVVVRSAVERQFEIIGEATRRIVENEPGLSLRIPEAREVIAFRNFLSHAYHLIDHSKVWTIVQSDVPALRAKVQQILDERPSA